MNTTNMSGQQHKQAFFDNTWQNNFAIFVAVLVLINSGAVANSFQTLSSISSGFTNASAKIRDLSNSVFTNKFPDVALLDPTLSQLRNRKDMDVSRVYVLGNRSTLYWEGNPGPYWTISNWSTARDAAQNLAVLKKIQPSYVFLDTAPNTLNFDLVPSFIRDTETFRWVMLNYDFHSKLDGGDLLKRKLIPRIDYSYFAEKLGNTVNIGALGFGIEIPSDRKTLMAMGPYLTIDKPRSNAVSEVPFDCPYGNFSISLLPKFDDTYFFPLNKIWFWSNTCVLTSPNPSVKLLYGKD